MKGWLAHAARMVAQRDIHALTTSFTAALQEQLVLKACYLLEPDTEGRHLTVQVKQQWLSWAVDDFNHPFSHVLQSDQPMLIMPQQLLYWQDAIAFRALCPPADNRTCGVLILPLHYQVADSKGRTAEHNATASDHSEQGVLAGLLVCLGAPDTLQSLKSVSDSRLQQLSGIFLQHRQMLQEVARHSSLQHQLNQHLQRSRSEAQTRQSQHQLKQELIGHSEAMEALRVSVIKAASSELAVMVQGETGTGKELVARAVHQYSSRKEGPFIAINCAAIPENLLESELFGHEKGAFSGADQQRQGLIAAAEKGTLFLDEIGDMPLSLQAKLLRVLENRCYRPLGGYQEVSADFRLVTATHVTLQDKARSGEFRQDLYYRLCQFPVTLPALRERRDDLEDLTFHFIRQFNHQHQRCIRGIHFSALDILNRHDYPGNVRELRNLVEFACAQTADGHEISAESLQERLSEATSADSLLYPTTIQSPDDDFLSVRDLKHALNQYESAIIRSRLSQFNGDRARAAESLSVPKRTLAHKCQKLEIE